MAKRLIPHALLIIVAVGSVFGMNLLPAGGGGSISTGLKVRVNVTTDPSDPNPLAYQWRSTDGQIQDRNAPSTEWVLPAGPGIHFAYVLVSNGQGGYTERRIAVNTDNFADRQLIPRAPMELTPPSAEPQIGVPFRAWLGGGLSSYRLAGEFNPMFPEVKVAVPNVNLVVTNPFNLLQESTSTSLSGDFTLQLFPPSAPLVLTDFLVDCTLQGGASLLPPFELFPFCTSLHPQVDEVIDIEANRTNRIDVMPTQAALGSPDGAWVTGSVLLEDGTACGTENEFFGVENTATAELVDLPGSRVPANSWGLFSNLAPHPSNLCGSPTSCHCAL